MSEREIRIKLLKYFYENNFYWKMYRCFFRSDKSLQLDIPLL